MRRGRKRRRRRRRRRSRRSGWSRIFSALLAPLGEAGFQDGSYLGPKIKPKMKPKFNTNKIAKKIWKNYANLFFSILGIFFACGACLFTIYEEWYDKDWKLFSKSSSGHFLTRSIFPPEGPSLTRSIFVSSPPLRLDWGIWHQAYLAVLKVSFPSLNAEWYHVWASFSHQFLLWGKWCTRIIYFYIQIYSDKGFYMLISTFYILAGLAFTSTIIEIIRQVWKWRHF